MARWWWPVGWIYSVSQTPRSGSAESPIESWIPIIIDDDTAIIPFRPCLHN